MNHRNSKLAAATLALIGVMPLSAEAAPPPNDDFANATTVSALPFSIRDSNIEATRDMDEPGSCGWGSSKTLWYRFVALEEISIRFASPWGNFDREVALFTGTKTSDLQMLECRPYAAGTSTGFGEVRVLAGTEVSVRVAGEDMTNIEPFGFTADRGTYDLTLEVGSASAPLRPPPGDRLAAPRPVQLPFMAWLPVHTTWGEDPFVGDCRPHGYDLPKYLKDLYLTWTPDADAKVVAAQTWRGGRSGIGIYELAADGPARVACSHTSGEDVHEIADFGHVSFDAEQGKTYLVQLWQGGLGLFESSGFALFEADDIDLSIDSISVGTAESLGARPIMIGVGVGGIRTTTLPPLAEGSPIWYGPSTLLKLVEEVEVSVAPADSPELAVSMTQQEFAWYFGPEPKDRILSSLPWQTHGCTGSYDVTARLLHPFSTDPSSSNDSLTVRVKLDDAPTVPGCFAAAIAQRLLFG